MNKRNILRNELVNLMKLIHSAPLSGLIFPNTFENLEKDELIDKLNKEITKSADFELNYNDIIILTSIVEEELYLEKNLPKRDLHSILQIIKKYFPNDELKSSNTNIEDLFNFLHLLYNQDVIQTFYLENKNFKMELIRSVWTDELINMYNDENIDELRKNSIHMMFGSPENNAMLIARLSPERSEIRIQNYIKYSLSVSENKILESKFLEQLNMTYSDIWKTIDELTPFKILPEINYLDEKTKGYIEIPCDIKDFISEFESFFYLNSNPKRTSIIEKWLKQHVYFDNEMQINMSDVRLFANNIFFDIYYKTYRYIDKTPEFELINNKLEHLFEEKIYDYFCKNINEKLNIYSNLGNNKEVKNRIGSSLIANLIIDKHYDREIDIIVNSNTKILIIETKDFIFPSNIEKAKSLRRKIKRATKQMDKTLEYMKIKFPNFEIKQMLIVKKTPAEHLEIFDERVRYLFQLDEIIEEVEKYFT